MVRTVPPTDFCDPQNNLFGVYSEGMMTPYLGCVNLGVSHAPSQLIIRADSRDRISVAESGERAKVLNKCVPP